MSLSAHLYRLCDAPSLAIANVLGEGKVADKLNSTLLMTSLLQSSRHLYDMLCLSLFLCPSSHSRRPLREHNNKLSQPLISLDLGDTVYACRIDFVPLSTSQDYCIVSSLSDNVWEIHVDF